MSSSTDTPSTPFLGSETDMNNVLQPDLDASRDHKFITENDECFVPADEFRKHWNIGDEPWRNFVRLLCGCTRFPFLLLQNPSKAHIKPYETMIQCHTIAWMSTSLQGLGLSLDEVCILDICALFSDDDLDAMDEENKWRAVEAAYALTEKIIRILRPSVLICCQCVTRGRWDRSWNTIWKPAENELAGLLCSSTKEATKRVAISIDLGDHTLWAIRGFHPMYFLRSAPVGEASERILLQLFHDVYEPCALWKRMIVGTSSRALVDEIESAFADLGLNDKMPTLRDAHQAFVKAVITYHDTVLQDVISHAMEQGSDYPRKWVKAPPSVGTSSMMSVVSENTGGMEQKFADAGEDETEVPQEEEAPKKKVMKRKVVRKVKKQDNVASAAVCPTQNAHKKVQH